MFHLGSSPLVVTYGVLSAALLCGLSAQAITTKTKKTRVAVVIGDSAPELERFAADQLCAYLIRLYGFRTQPATSVPASADLLFLVGSPDTNPFVRQATARKPFPKVSDQGIVLRRVQFQRRPALLIGGGSPPATLWAVYELVERWGVRYLLHGDILPRTSEHLSRSLGTGLEGEGIVLEPKLAVRQWRVINDFALGPESWGMADYRPVIDQLVKNKFNRLFLSTYPYQPFLDLEVKGIRRRQASLWFGFHYPITDDMIGRQLFGDTEEFWNPDLPLHASYSELSAAAQRHAHNLTEYAHQRGMQCVINATLTEFPPEFASLLRDSQTVHQLAGTGVVPGPGTDPEDPALTELAAAVLRTTVNTYPEVDFIALGMPEFRQWSGLYERAWRLLDDKYGIERVRPLADVLAAASKRADYPGGAQRALQEVKGDIVALYFYDRLLTELHVLSDTRRPDMKFIYDSVAEELLPLLSRILPRGWETLNFVDYTASRIVRRRAVLRTVPSREVPCSLIYTLHDDNVGVLPQITTGSMHELTKDLRRFGWAGFSTRYWLIGDHDPCIAYLSRAAWDGTTTPEAIYRDQITSVCGEACVEEMLTAFREVEATTVGLEQHGLGLTFPVPGMMMQNWVPHPMPGELLDDRRSYQRALEAARRARGRARPEGRDYVDYWVGRLEFGVGYLDAIEALRRAAMAEADNQPEQTLRYAELALAAARRSLEAYARVARDQSDRGAIAVMNEYVYRPLRAKVEELKREN